jgi:hypothetical protein
MTDGTQPLVTGVWPDRRGHGPEDFDLQHSVSHRGEFIQRRVARVE